MLGIEGVWFIIIDFIVIVLKIRVCGDNFILVYFDNLGEMSKFFVKILKLVIEMGNLNSSLCVKEIVFVI